MLHKLPVILKPNLQFPSMGGDDETNVLPAFQKLINLFWIFDQSGAFDILENSDANPFNFGEMGDTSRDCLVLLQKKLEEVPVDWEVSNDVQKADICATRQWMRALLWSVYMNHGRTQQVDQTISMSLPFQIAKEFLVVISQLPNTAIEAHGPTMVSTSPSSHTFMLTHPQELKIYGIASAVAEALASNTQASWISIERPRDILNSLQRMLASFRGSDKNHFSTLFERMGTLKPDSRLLLEPSSRSIEELDDQWQNENSTSLGSALNLGSDPASPGIIERFFSPTYYRMQQTPPQFDRSWLENLSLSSPFEEFV